jgi:hypothetical protein
VLLASNPKRERAEALKPEQRSDERSTQSHGGDRKTATSTYVAVRGGGRHL